MKGTRELKLNWVAILGMVCMAVNNYPLASELHQGLVSKHGQSSKSQTMLEAMAKIPLVDHVARYLDLAPSERDALSELPRTAIKARASLFDPFHGPSTLVFVESGLVRLFTVDEGGRERTIQFGLEGWWVSDWDSFESGGPPELTLQAIEDATLVSLTKDGFESLLARFPRLERYFRQIFQRAHAAGQRKALLLETRSGEQMYLDFLKRHLDFLQRVPQSMLASYLGISPEYLSRVRSRRPPT